MTHNRRPLGRLRMALAFLGFVSIGLPDGLLGVAWPSIRRFFALPLDALGSLLIVTTAGYMFSSFSSGRVLSRINVGALLALSCVVTACALGGYAIAPRWPMMLALAALAGLGAGAIDAGINTYVATHHSARTLNWLHACYGAGALSGPLIMGGVLAAGRPWQQGYAIVCLAQIGLAAAFAATYRRWPQPTGSAAHAEPPASFRTTLRLPLMWVSMAVFLVYTGLEAAFGAWVYTLFTEARGLSMRVAAPWVSIYWSGLMTGRLAVGFVIGRLDANTVVGASVLGIAVGAALIAANVAHPVSCAGLALVGFAAGPVYPSLIATTPLRFGTRHGANAVGFEVAASALGQALLPTGVGLVAAHAGPESIGAALLAAALVLLVLQAPLLAGNPASPSSIEEARRTRS